MAKPKANAALFLKIDIDEVLVHYAFGDRWPIDSDGPELNEHLSVTVWGTVASPEEKKGRDIQATLYGSEGFSRPWRTFMAGEESPPIGSLQWSATRAATVYVPPDTMWHLASHLSSGALKRLQICVDTPLRGTVPVRSLHLMTRDFEVNV